MEKERETATPTQRGRGGGRDTRPWPGGENGPPRNQGGTGEQGKRGGRASGSAAQLEGGKEAQGDHKQGQLPTERGEGGTERRARRQRLVHARQGEGAGGTGGVSTGEREEREG